MSLLNLIPLFYRVLGLAAMLAVVAGIVGLKLHQYGNDRQAVGYAMGYGKGHAEAEALRADYTAKAASAAADYRQREADMQARVTAAEDHYAPLQAEHARLLVSQRALLSERGELRNAIAAYAAGSGSAAPDSVAACNQRAAALGGLLAEALRSDAESAASAEGNADAVRTLLEAWPKE